jgi:hypothetical protein
MPFTFTTIPFQTLMRKAAVDLLTEYAQDASLKLQVYPGRPRSVYPPTAFPDLMREETVFTGPTQRQRTITVELVAVWGLFDSAEAVAQRDAFCDGFADYVTDNRGKADPRSVIASVAFQDIPNFIPDWLPPEEQASYYATRIALEGYVSA